MNQGWGWEDLREDKGLWGIELGKYSGERGGREVIGGEEQNANKLWWFSGFI